MSCSNQHRFPPDDHNRPDQLRARRPPTGFGRRTAMSSLSLCSWQPRLRSSASTWRTSTRWGAGRVVDGLHGSGAAHTPAGLAEGDAGGPTGRESFGGGQRQHDDLFTPDEVQQGRGGWLSVRIALRDSTGGFSAEYIRPHLCSAGPSCGTVISAPTDANKPRSSEAWAGRVKQGRSAAAEAAAHPVRPGCGSRCGARLSSQLPRLGSEPVRRAARLPPDPHRACWRA